MIWWHKLRGHTVTMARVSVSSWDMWSRGELHRCDCGTIWAK